ncbi:MAG: GNAT family N-acetyltransferase [Actinomycetota bacterium]|nr:GNAT family N-acetyltransferase [Actinomycetota bacterium]
MPLTVRAIAFDELPDFYRVDQRGFGVAGLPERESKAWPEAELDRTRCAFDGDEMVGCTRQYTFELTMPGGTRIPVAAVSAVAVQPTHRRQGVLTQMIGALHDDARERGEIAAVLTASEGAIYGRFGYGIATWRLGMEAERRAVRFVAPFADDGRMRMPEQAEAEKILPGLYEQAQARAGMVSRPSYWWPSVFWGWSLGEEKAFFVAVHEDASGTADGYVAYEITGEWNGGLGDRRLLVWDIQSTSRETHAALWQFVFGIDLVAIVAATNIAVDDPLRLMVADPRRIRADFVNDGLWVYPLDPAAFLASRTYSTEGSLVVEVHGPGSDGLRLAVDGGPDGATAKASTASPDLTCSVATLGACGLGGNAWSIMYAAGLVEENTPGALRRADVMFSTQPAPAMLSDF